MLRAKRYMILNQKELIFLFGRFFVLNFFFVLFLILRNSNMRIPFACVNTVMTTTTMIMIYLEWCVARAIIVLHFIRFYLDANVLL